MATMWRRTSSLFMDCRLSRGRYERPSCGRVVFSIYPRRRSTPSGTCGRISGGHTNEYRHEKNGSMSSWVESVGAVEAAQMAGRELLEIVFRLLSDLPYFREVQADVVVIEEENCCLAPLRNIRPTVGLADGKVRFCRWITDSPQAQEACSPRD